VCGCGRCESEGVRILNQPPPPRKPNNTYYQPTKAPTIHQGADRRPDLDPRNLPLRTEEQYIQQLIEISTAPTKTAAGDLAKKYGINGPSILSRLSSFHITICAPRDAMHMLYEHLVPMLISFWKGAYKPWKAKGLDHGQPYVIPDAKWEEIGKLTAESSKTIPGAFCRALPDIHKEEHHYIAETYAVWMAQLAPKLLQDAWLPQHCKYYDHAVLLSKIIRTVESYEISRASIQQGGELYEDIQTFFEQYQEYVFISNLHKFEVIDYLSRYYYQFKDERLPACNSTIHNILHIPDDITALGPLWVAWCFVMERFCGSLLACISSRSNPYPSITRRTLEHVQLDIICHSFPNIKAKLTWPPTQSPIEFAEFGELLGNDTEDILRDEHLSQREVMYRECGWYSECQAYNLTFL
jgi:hypothetical protein